MLIMALLVAAAVVVFALNKKRDVTFNVKVLGAHVLFEARGEATKQKASTRT